MIVSLETLLQVIGEQTVELHTLKAELRRLQAEPEPKAGDDPPERKP